MWTARQMNQQTAMTKITGTFQKHEKTPKQKTYLKNTANNTMYSKVSFGEPCSCLQQSLDWHSNISLHETRQPWHNKYILEHISLHNFFCTKTWCLLHKFVEGLNKLSLVLQPHSLPQNLQQLFTLLYFIILSMMCLSVMVSVISTPLSCLLNLQSPKA